MAEALMEVFLARDVKWQYEHEHPFYQITPHSYEWVDPMPAYAHSAHVVHGTLEHCKTVFPPVTDMTVAVISHESRGRTNGWSSKDYYGDKPWHAVVCLSAKRIPIHPAMSRYVTAHEYGHHVHWWLEHLRGLEENEMYDEYAKIRNVRNIPGTPGQWHKAVGEVFACDFRILLAGVELEYWPHPGIERPDSLATDHPVRQFWKDVILETSNGNETTATPV